MKKVVKFGGSSLASAEQFKKVGNTFYADGKVIGLHTSTVSSQTNPYILLNDEQVKELKNIYEDYIHKMLDDLCDEKC